MCSVTLKDDTDPRTHQLQFIFLKSPFWNINNSYWLWPDFGHAYEIILWKQRYWFQLFWVEDVGKKVELILNEGLVWHVHKIEVLFAYDWKSLEIRENISIFASKSWNYLLSVADWNHGFSITSIRVLHWKIRSLSRWFVLTLASDFD